MPAPRLLVHAADGTRVLITADGTLTTEPDTFGPPWQVIRHALQLTQRELAAWCGVSESAVRSWEAGTRRPSRSALIALYHRLPPARRQRP